MYGDLQPWQMACLAAERSRVAAAAGNDASGTIAFSTSSNGGTAQFLYLIDTKAHAFAIYRVDPSNPKGPVQARGRPAIPVRPEAESVQQPRPGGRRGRVDGEDLGAPDAISCEGTWTCSPSRSLLSRSLGTRIEPNTTGR